jgi:hypothetical protein
MLIIALMFAVIEVNAQLLSHPDNESIGIPSGYVETNAQVPNTNMYLNPNVDGITSWSNNTLISYTFSGYAGSKGYANNVYTVI